MRRDNDVAVEFYGRAIPLQNVLTGFCCQQPLLKILLIGFYLLSVTTSDEYITKCQVQILAGLIFLLSASTRGVNYLQSSTKAFKQFVTCFHTVFNSSNIQNQVFVSSGNKVSKWGGSTSSFSSSHTEGTGELEVTTR